ncbi:MAG TPA: succinate dehydrogenase, hydrophobic membrane anchor protein [Rhizomicrobium sp.]|nr:succinate dehydrogenase, hydrophobic membrane anchor protein [Rhizomicrobium sp.]
MNSGQTPLHKVRGLGASHSGTGHFWRERVSAVALAPLSLWFAYVMLGLAGTSEVTALQFLAHPWNALLMGAFVAISLYHMRLGLQVVIDDYIHAAGMKIFLVLMVLLAVLVTGGLSLFAIIRIAAL